MRCLLSLVLGPVVACSGTAGVREHAERIAVATDCDRHGCASTPAASNLGDGCYVVRDRLYQCSTDGPSEVTCFEIPPCAEVCELIVTDARGFEISTDRCEQLWWRYQSAHQPPPTCKPVVLVAHGPAAAPTLRQLVLPDAIMLEVIRTGRTNLLFEAEACATADGVVVGEASRTTGFVELDAVLRGEVSKVALPPGECAKVALAVGDFYCRWW